MSATPYASSTAARFVSSNEIRTRFSRAMSEMYRKEVPQYGTLIDLVADVNAVALQADPELRQRMTSSGELERLDVERHGAIRDMGHGQVTCDIEALTRIAEEGRAALT